MTEDVQDLVMLTDFETDWILLNIDRIDGIRRKYRARSLQIWWREVTGLANGEVKLYATNDESVQSILQTIPVNNYDNTDNAPLILLDNSFKYIKAKFIKNSITGGRLNLHITYD